ncbi:unnamed protein product [Adineta steineri]|uniref:Uncharacterized protein n=1 Tax=Adineta steineri TaxID=433720 RepID=A0A814GGA8_9BILA|nr:unnamed protein product [Adineta steineri]CAF4018621.1 unnamed protein product [Adineta steineri]
MGNNTSSQTSSLRISKSNLIQKFTGSSYVNREDVTLIWLDKTIDTTRTTLREMTDYVLLYTEIEPCITYIRSITNERIFLIVSGDYAELCLNEIHDLPQIDIIFIFCMNLSSIDKDKLVDTNSYTKIIDIFDNEDKLIQSIREELTDLQKRLLTFSIYDKQTSIKDLSKESALFLWFQLFKDIIFQLPKSEESKYEMIEQCRQYYHGNQEELTNIEKFAQTYTEQDAVHWYTKQCFISRLCNKALRTQDIELLYIFRYYIQDLHKRLSLEHQSFRNTELNPPILTLYRGLKLTHDDITHFQSNIDSLVLMNGFFFTTRNYDLELESALKLSKHSVNILPTLLIIQVNVQLDHVIFAKISSQINNSNEDEILFDIDCAFKIHEVYFNNKKNVWIITMSLTNENRLIAGKYIETNKREIEQGNVLLIFGLLLTEMEQYQQAQIYYEKLLLANIIDDKAALYTNTGRIKFQQGLFNEAVKDFHNVYDIQREQKPKNYFNLARTMNTLGLIYIEEKNYDLALDYHFDVLKTYKQHIGISELLLANSNDSIGIIFTHKHDYDQALKYLFRAMKLYEKYLPNKDHPTMATNYNNIGLVFYYIKQHSQALEYCLEALTIREKVLPITHTHIADSYNNVALVYHHLFEYDKAFHLFQRSLQIYENDYNQKMRIPICLNNIGLLYLDQYKYDEAIEYYLKALDIYINENDEQQFQEELCFTLNNLGVAYEMKCDYDNALKYYELVLEEQREDSEKFGRLLVKIGNIYHKKGDNDQALNYYDNALNRSQNYSSELLSSILMSMGIIYHRQRQYDLSLDTYKRVVSIHKHDQLNHELDLAWTYNNIGCLYDDMGDMKRALRYQEKAYDIRRQFLQSTHPDLAISLNNLGRIHQTLAHRSGGNPFECEQALQNYKAALHIRRKSLPIDHPDLAISYYNLALIHVDQQEYEQAYSEIQKALKIQTKKLSADHPDLAQTLKLERQVKILLDYRMSLARYR